MKKSVSRNAYRYIVYAKRKHEKRWCEWVRVDDYDEAVMQSEKIEKAGYLSRIIDREEHKSKGAKNEN